jgi:hypothetical protein
MKPFISATVAMLPLWLCFSSPALSTALGLGLGDGDFTPRQIVLQTQADNSTVAAEFPSLQRRGLLCGADSAFCAGKGILSFLCSQSSRTVGAYPT